MEINMSIELLNYAVNAIVDAIGSGKALSVLGFPQQPGYPDGVNDYQNRLHLGAFVQSHERDSEEDARKLAVSIINNGEKFLKEHRMERLRQARTTFNAAIILVSVGTVVILGGVVLLYCQRLGAGALTSAAGIVSNIMSALLFKLNKDANDRLDKATASMATLKSIRQILEISTPTTK